MRKPIRRVPVLSLFVSFACLAVPSPAQAEIVVKYANGTVADTIWVLPQATVDDVPEPTTFELEITDGTNPLTMAVVTWECGLQCTRTKPLSASVAVLQLAGAVWRVTTAVNPGDMSDEARGAGKLVVRQVGELPKNIAAMVPAIEQMRPVLECPLLDRPGFIRGQTVGSEIPEDESFPQITYVTVKPCGVCDFAVDGQSPVTVEVSFTYRGTRRDGDDCDPQKDSACDPAECPNPDDADDTRDEFDVYRKDFDVQPYERTSDDPLTVFIEAKNNLPALGSPPSNVATTEAVMDLVVQRTKAERDQLPKASDGSLPLWVADPKAYIAELSPGLARLGEAMGLEHRMELEAELGAAVSIGAGISLPPKESSSTEGAAGSAPGAEKQGGSIEILAEGGFAYTMALQASPSEIDLSSNLAIGAKGAIGFELPNGPAGLECALAGSGDAPIGLVPPSFIPVLTGYKMTELTAECSGEVPVYGVKYRVPSEVMRRYVEEIAAYISVINGFEATLVGDPFGADMDRFELAELKMEPGVKGTVSFEADFDVVEVGVGVLGQISVPITLCVAGCCPSGPDWSVEIGVAAGGALGLQVKAGRWVLVDVAEERSFTASLGVIQPATCDADGDPGTACADLTTCDGGPCPGDLVCANDPASGSCACLPPPPPPHSRPSVITGTAAAVDSSNHLWFASVKALDCDGIPGDEDGTLVVQDCGTDHDCSGDVEMEFCDPGFFAHSPAIAIGPADLPVVAWSRAEAIGSVDYTDSSLLTARFLGAGAGFGSAYELRELGSDHLRYGLAMDVGQLNSANPGRVSLVWVEDQDPYRFACTDASAACTVPLPNSSIEMVLYDFDGSGNVTNETPATVSPSFEAVRDNPDVAVDFSGRSLIVYEESKPPDLYAQVVSAGGSVGTGRRQVTVNTHVDTQPSVEFDSLGNALLVWSVTSDGRTLGTPSMNPTGAGGARAVGITPLAVVAATADGGADQDLFAYTDLQQAPQKIAEGGADLRDPSVMSQIVVYSSKEDGGADDELWLLDLSMVPPDKVRLTDDSYSQRNPAVHVGTTTRMVYVSNEPSDFPFPPGPAKSDNLWLLEFPSMAKTQLTNTDIAERHPAFDASGNSVIFSTSTRMADLDESGEEEVITDGCNLWRLDISNPQTPIRTPFTDGAGCDTQPTWHGDRVVYRCDYLDDPSTEEQEEELVEQTRAEAPCDVRLRALAAGGQSGLLDTEGVATTRTDYTFDWTCEDVSGAPCFSVGETRGSEVAWHFDQCSTDTGGPAVHEVTLTATDCTSDEVDPCVPTPYTTALTIGTDGLHPPLRVDVDLDRGSLVAGSSESGQVEIVSTIAGGDPPYQVSVDYGDGGSPQNWSDVAGHFASVTHSYDVHSIPSSVPLDCGAGSGVFCGTARVRDGSGLTASRDFRIHVGPLRESKVGVAGAPLKAVIRPVLPYSTRPRQGLCEASASLPPASGGPVTRLLPAAPEGIEPGDARSPSLGPGDQLLFFQRPGGNPIGVQDVPMLGTLDPVAKALLDPNPLPGMQPPNLPAPADLVQYGRFSQVRMAALRLSPFGSGVYLSPAADVSRPGLMARHPQIATGPAGTFIVVWRGEHTGGQETQPDGTPLAVGLDGDVHYSKGKVENQSVDVALGLLNTFLRILVPRPVIVESGVLDPDAFTSWRARVVMGTSGNPTVVWVDKTDPGNDQGLDLLNFESPGAMPDSSWPIRPPFGDDGADDFRVGGGTSLFCPLGLGSDASAQGPFPFNIQVTQGAGGTFSIVGPTFPTIGTSPDESVQVSAEGEIWHGTVGPLGQVEVGGPAVAVLLQSGDPVFGVPLEVIFTTEPVTVSTHPGQDGVYCSDDDQPGVEFQIVGQSMDARGLTVLNTNIRLGFDKTPGLELLGQMTLQFSSKALAERRLLVSETGADRVVRFDSATGESLGVFAPSSLGPESGLSMPGGLAIGPDDNLYVADRAGNRVLRFDGGAGEFVDEFVVPFDGGLFDPREVAFGPDGHLYVSGSDDSIKRYDGTTGTYLPPDIVPAGAGGLAGEGFFVFGPDDQLFVSSTGTGNIKVYDGTGGGYLGDFLAPGEVLGPRGLAFGPDHNLYVAVVNGGVSRFNSDGQPMGLFGQANPYESGLIAPATVIFGPDNDLYVSDEALGNVKRYANGSGEFLGVLGDANGLTSPTYMTLLRVGDADGDGIPDDVDKLEDVAARQIQQFGDDDSYPYWDAGVTGGGDASLGIPVLPQLISFHDTGFSLDAADMSDTQELPGTPGPTHRKVERLQPAGPGDLLSCDGDGERVGHGVVVAGTAIGSATRFVGPYYNGAFFEDDPDNGTPGVFDEAFDAGFDGVAPGARGVLWDLASDCPDPEFPDLPLLGLMDSANFGATLHNLSFGDDVGVYTLDTLDLDSLHNLNPESLALVAAGDGGELGAGTLSRLATCKNCVAVGAAEQPPGAPGWAAMAKSSEGPTPSGRPGVTLVAPGVDYSCKSTDPDQNDPVVCDRSNGVYTGTSIATAAASGAAALVRDYLAQGFSPDGSKLNADNPQDQAPVVSGQLVKAILIASTDPVDRTGAGYKSLRDHRWNDSWGYGAINLSNALPLSTHPGSTIGLAVSDSLGYVSEIPLPFSIPAEFSSYAELWVDLGRLAVVLTWSHPDGANGSIENDLDLTLTYCGFDEDCDQTTDNVEWYGNWFTEDLDEDGFLGLGEDLDGDGVIDAAFDSLPTDIDADGTVDIVAHDTVGASEAVFLTVGGSGSFNSPQVGLYRLGISRKAGGTASDQTYAVAVAGGVPVTSAVRWSEPQAFCGDPLSVLVIETDDMQDPACTRAACPAAVVTNRTRVAAYDRSGALVDTEVGFGFFRRPAATSISQSLLFDSVSLATSLAPVPAGSGELPCGEGYRYEVTYRDDVSGLPVDRVTSVFATCGGDCDGDGVPADVDCDDADPDRFPGNPEVCDGLDNDCDSEPDDGLSPDADGDGHTAPGSCEGSADDCDDDASTVHPGASERCDGLDNDCNGLADEGLSTDADGDGYYTPGSCAEPATDCADGDATVFPGSPETCDGVDNDCDGDPDDGLSEDLDGDGHTTPDSCSGFADDCDDTDPLVYGGALELCDGLDNDCDQAVPANETDNDADGYRVCESDCNDFEPEVNPGAPEVCNDGIDNDCNAATLDEFDGDGDAFLCSVDCDDADGDVWAVPGEALGIFFAASKESFDWSVPPSPGGTVLLYDVLRSEDPLDFGAATTCIEPDGLDTTATDGGIPAADGGLFFYLVRAENLCGPGALGVDSEGTPRDAGLACP